MRPGARRSRWGAGARAAFYLIAFAVVAGGCLVAIGVLLLHFVGVFFAGGILAVLVGLGLLGYVMAEKNRNRSPR